MKQTRIAEDRRSMPVAGAIGLIAAATALLVGVTLQLAGVDAAASLKLALLAAVNVAGAAYLWQLVGRAGTSLAELMGAGVATSFILVIVAGVALPDGPPPLVIWLLVPVAATVTFVVAMLRHRKPRRVRVDSTTLLGGLVAFAAAMALNRFRFSMYHLAPPIDVSTFHPDNVYFQSLAVANAHIGLGVGAGLSDWPIRYHWFAYGWAGSLQEATGTAAFAALIWVLPVLSVLGIAFLASAWAGRLSRRRWVPAVAALLVCVGRFVADSSGIVVNWDSGSLTASVVLLLFACWLITTRTRSPATYWVVAVAAAVMTGTKISTVAVLLGALWLTAIAGLLARSSWRRRATGLALAATAGAAVVFVVFIAGQNDSGGLALQPALNPFAFESFGEWASAAKDAFAPALATTLALLPGWLGLVYLVARRRTRAKLPTVLGLGLAVSAVAPLWILVDSRPNTAWFLTAATAPVWVVSSLGAGQSQGAARFASLRQGRLWLAIAAALSVALTAVWAWTVEAQGWSGAVVQIAFLAGLVVSAAIVFVVVAIRSSRRAVPITAFVLVTAGVLSPLAMVVGERLVPGIVSASAVRSAVVAGPAPEFMTPMEPSDLAAVIETLAEVLEPGSVVATTDSRLAPALSVAGLRAFDSNRRYAVKLGPQGSDVEFDRRRALVYEWMSDPTAENTSRLCRDDVSAVVAALAPGRDGSADYSVVARVADVAVARLHCLGD